MKLPRITIGIPAHNEGPNIGHLLADLMRQETWSFHIEEILVASDGSTDDTNSLVKMFSDDRICIMQYRERKGKAFRQNQLIEKAQGDILVLLDADIVITDPHFLEKLVAPIIKDQADMTSAAILELPARTFFESVLDVSMRLKHTLFSAFKQGDNLYSCHGPARAFSRALFTKLEFPVSEGEDMYSYLACIYYGFRFRYVQRAVVGYRLPSTFVDHKRQSVRYLRSKKIYRKLFGPEFVDQEMYIPLSAYAFGFIHSIPLMLRHPVQTLTYVFVLGTVKIISVFSSQTYEMWKVASSKVVRV